MKLLSTCAAAAALALLASAGAASAQDVSFNAVAASDYVFRGFSQSNEDLALQAGVDLTTESGFYAGAWASNVDFGDSTDAEVDIYGGYRTEASGFALDFGVIGYLYVDEPSAADYNYVEFKAAASRAFGPVTAGAAVYYSPDFFGADEAATYVEANVAVTPVENLTLSAAVGEQFLDVTDDYATWNAGATYAFSDTGLALDVRYFDTDVDNAPLAKERVVVSLKVVF